MDFLIVGVVLILLFGVSWWWGNRKEKNQ